jgi:hypothetical protein
MAIPTLSLGCPGVNVRSGRRARLGPGVSNSASARSDRSVRGRRPSGDERVGEKSEDAGPTFWLRPLRRVDGRWCRGLSSASGELPRTCGLPCAGRRLGPRLARETSCVAVVLDPTGCRHAELPRSAQVCAQESDGLVARPRTPLQRRRARPRAGSTAARRTPRSSARTTCGAGKHCIPPSPFTDAYRRGPAIAGRLTIGHHSAEWGNDEERRKRVDPLFHDRPAHRGNHEDL